MGDNPWILLFGVASAATLVALPLDRPIQRAMLAEDIQDNRAIRGSASALAFAGGPGPFALSATLYVAGRARGNAGMSRLGARIAEGVMLAATVDGIVKGISGRALPDDAQQHGFSFGRGFHEGNGPFVSFPSGHTAAGFAVATVVAVENARAHPERRWVAPLVFGTATMIGVARLYQNVHWASDLPLGAAIGIWSGAEAASWHHGRSRSRMSQVMRGLSAAPNAHGGMELRWSSGAGTGPHQDERP